MQVLIKDIDFSLAEGISEGTVIFEVNGNQYRASSIHEEYEIGEIVDVDFTALEKQHTWDDRFGGNPNKDKCLVHLQDWTYDGYAVITSIDPIIADFGDIELDIGNWTNDQRVIGEFIYWPIAELRIHRKAT